MTKMCKYLRSRGLRVKTLAQELKVSNQAISKLGENGVSPNIKTLHSIATALTNLGFPTTVVDLVKVLYEKE